MQAVSNTSPLLNLAIIEQLDLLASQFDTVWIPPAVLEELRIDEALPGVNAIQKSLQSGWLKTREVRNKQLVQLLERELDRGEAAAIALAAEIKPDYLLLDERDARRIAKAMQFSVTGVLGVLIKARQRGKVDNIEPLLNALEKDAGFYITQQLRAQILR
jgi:uncharacterized protein